jgi:proteasome lid subunit RPN8/RPN11
MDQLSEKIYLKADHWEQMFADVRERISEEACGLVAGVNQTSAAVYPVINELHSPVRFRMDPEQQLNAFNQIEAQDWELLAIYHSHLGGPEQPSAIDIAEANYPGVIDLIWSRVSGEWDCRGFLIEDGSVQPVQVVIVEST